jgi:hypothetical protein
LGQESNVISELKLVHKAENMLRVVAALYPLRVLLGVVDLSERILGPSVQGFDSLVEVELQVLSPETRHLEPQQE